MKRGLSGHGRIKIYQWGWLKVRYTKDKKRLDEIGGRNNEWRDCLNRGLARITRITQILFNPGFKQCPGALSIYPST